MIPRLPFTLTEELLPHDSAQVAVMRTVNPVFPTGGVGALLMKAWALAQSE